MGCEKCGDFVLSKQEFIEKCEALGARVDRNNLNVFGAGPELRQKCYEFESKCGAQCKECGKVYCINCASGFHRHLVTGGAACLNCGGALGPYEASANSGCFIATACFETPHSTEVLKLQKFKKDFLMSSILGTLFVKFYYIVSPAISNYIRKKDLLKKVIRDFLIKPIVRIID